ncbi:hypothetical protein B0H66DRAFT_589296 [Apodospora peruviana]|uniref:Heterokaryon incompatibility domain-containing protein n=1 Tax=Apodospora peruviana TaxID=516989 RepID=A0AAE0MCJ8_9PEZI|nr:hypothetical protein B0H66DRAFT_589296 [Apodospora peruviana]
MPRMAQLWLATSQGLKVSWTRKETIASHGRQRDEMILSSIGELLLINVSRARHALGDYMRTWWRSGNGKEERELREVREEVYLVSADSTDSSPATKHYGDSKALIVKWLDACEMRHDGAHPLCQGNWKRRFRSLVDSNSFGVIDVVGKRLCNPPVKNGEPARFGALSYVWGEKTRSGHEALQTTAKNVSSRIEIGGLSKVWDRFPRAIRDALNLAEDLMHGEDGKGLDRLRSWEANAKNMDLIYGNAAFTICAADGADSNAGLLALHCSEKDEPRRAWITPEVRLTVSKPPESVIDASEWNHRAWTFQEHILSQRLYFECRKTSWSQEDGPSEVGNGRELAAWHGLLHQAYKDLEQRPIRDWLLNHTWIIWHIRDREGGLHPLSRRRPGCCRVNDLDVDENTALDGDYGRPLRDTWYRDHARGQTAFSKRLPDHPFGVRGPNLKETRNHMFFHNRSGGGSSYDDHLSFDESKPDHRPYQPVLQFWTLECEFPVVRGDNSLAMNNLQRFNIMDTSTNCQRGTVVMDEEWADEHIKDGQRCTFVALSEAKCITKEEKDSWARYPGSAEEGSEWCCFYVMAVTMDVKRGVSERVGLGKIFQRAFQKSGCKWSEIILG